MQPAQKRQETTRFPVVYVTDGNLTFDMFKGISYIMQPYDVPRFILVGIGYPSDCPAAGALLRGRDLTFPDYVKFGRRQPTVEGMLMPEEGAKYHWGAEDFQQFIGNELIPLIDETYATLPGDRTYFGHSAGGGFGLYTLFAQSKLFKNYIVSSPGLIYHGGSPAGINYEDYDFMLQEARKFIATGKALPGIRLYMSVGTAEEFEPLYAQWRLTSSFYRIAGLLKAAAIPGLELMTGAFPGTTHQTVWPMAFIQECRPLSALEHGKIEPQARHSADVASCYETILFFMATLVCFIERSIRGHAHPRRHRDSSRRDRAGSRGRPCT